MQGLNANFRSGDISRCPYFHGKALPKTAEAPAEESKPAQISDHVSISPFEPADAGPLTKTCVTSAAKATMGMLPGVAKAGCPHAA